jgi:hypothetical protein
MYTTNPRPMKSSCDETLVPTAIKCDKRQSGLYLHITDFIMTSAQDSEIVYSDRWLTLRTDGTLVIYRYNFPTLSSRTLQVSRIVSMATATALNLRWWELKVWGMTSTWVYWTLDGQRLELLRLGRFDEIRKRSLVIKTDEGWFHNIGVTCENVESFLTEVERMGVTVLREPINSHLHTD